MGGQGWGAGESASPYPAFAAPGGYHPSQGYDGPAYDAYGGGGPYPQPGIQPGPGVYEDSHVVGAAYAYGYDHEQPRHVSPPPQSHSPPHDQLSRTPSKSLLNYPQQTTPPSPPTPPSESYAAHYAVGGSASAGGHSPGPLPNPHAGDRDSQVFADSGSGEDFDDDEEDRRGPKVLKVANE